MTQPEATSAIPPSVSQEESGIIDGMLPDGFHRLDPRFVHVQQITGLITAGILSAIALLALGSLGLAVGASWMMAGFGAAACGARRGRGRTHLPL